MATPICEAFQDHEFEVAPENSSQLLKQDLIGSAVEDEEVGLHINTFPSEIFLQIFSYLDYDDFSLLSAELTCSRWKENIEKNRIYAKKCRQLLSKHPDLSPTFVQHNFEEKIQFDSCQCKKFYYKITKMSGRWQCSPRVTVIDCLEAEVGGQKMKVSEDWARRHNYTGFYDLVWLAESSMLVCSVFDSIQVWDMSDYSCVSIIGGNLLDGVGLKSWCFHASDKTLFCGTNKGQIRVFDLMTGQVTGTFRHPQNMSIRSYICDLKVHMKDLLAVDWLGNMQQWKLLPNGDLSYVSSFTPLSNDLATLTQYTSKQTERLVEFNDFIGVTNVRQLFCIWNVRDVHRVASWITTETYVLCSKVLGHDAFWGEQNGSVHQFQYQEHKPSITTMTGHVQTTFKDSITSLSVTREHVVFGDKNGEIHCAKLPLSQNNGFKFVLETGHQFGAFVWAIQIDGARIFSGDSNAKMVIHDFWDYEERKRERRISVSEKQSLKKFKS